MGHKGRHVLKGDCGTLVSSPLLCFLAMRRVVFAPPHVPSIMARHVDLLATEPANHGLGLPKLEPEGPLCLCKLTCSSDRKQINTDDTQGCESLMSPTLCCPPQRPCFPILRSSINKWFIRHLLSTCCMAGSEGRKTLPYY